MFGKCFDARAGVLSRELGTGVKRKPEVHGHGDKHGHDGHGDEHGHEGHDEKVVTEEVKEVKEVEVKVEEPAEVVDEVVAEVEAVVETKEEWSSNLSM